jgi:hypothetical protein
VLAQVDAYLSQTMFSRMRPTLGQSTATFPDIVGAGVGARAIVTNHAYDQASGALQPSVSLVAELNNQPAAVYAGATKTIASTLPKTNWRQAQNGTGFKAWVVCSNQIVTGFAPYFATASLSGPLNGAGVCLFRQAPDSVRAILSDGATTYGDTSTVGTAPVGVGQVLSLEYNSSLTNKLVLKRNGVSLYAASPTLDTPSNTDPFSTMTLGATGGSNGGDFSIGEVLFYFGTPSAALNAAVSQYLLLRYNLVGG